MLELKQIEFKAAFFRDSESVFALMIADVGIAASLEDGGDQPSVAFCDGGQEWGVAMVVLLIGVDARIEKNAGGAIALVFDSVVERVSPKTITEIDVGCAADENLDRFPIVQLSRQHQWCDPVNILDIDIEKMMIHKSIDDPRIFLLDAIKERAASAFIEGMRIRAMLGEHFERSEIEIFGGHHESSFPRMVLGVGVE